MRISSASYLSLIPSWSLRGTQHKIFLSKILAMLEAWDIERKRVTCFGRDNAANLTAATRERGFCHICCVDHTLQLAINDSLKNNTVHDLLKSGRSTVGHFNRSSVARQLFTGVQTQLQLPHQLIQECTTCWNCTYFEEFS